VGKFYRLAQAKARRYTQSKTDKIKKNFYMPELIQLRKLYPHGYHKYDKKVEIDKFSIGQFTFNELVFVKLKKF
jgi:hypothetical protein